MNETMVYFVETRTAEQPVAVCRWVERFYDQGKRVQVAAGSAAAAQNLDQLLWTFAQGSFIPHRISSARLTASEGAEPVIITLEEAPLADLTVLICDAAVELESLLRYEAVVHFVLLDDAARRDESRALWQCLRDRGVRTIHVPYGPGGLPP